MHRAAKGNKFAHLTAAGYVSIRMGTVEDGAAVEDGSLSMP